MPKASTEGQQLIMDTVAKLGENATFGELVATLKKKDLSLGQVRGAVANCAKYGLIKKGADDVYRTTRRRLKQAAKRPARREQEQPTRHRRSSVVVAAQAVADFAKREADAAQQIADIFAQFPSLRDQLAKELRKRQRS